MQYFLLYLAVINLAAAAVTIHDKRAAKKHRWRVPEKTLLLLAAAGGALAMYVTMLTIRHKTKHAKFMLGIPAILGLQFLCIFLFFSLGKLNLIKFWVNCNCKSFINSFQKYGSLCENNVF